MGFFFYFVLKFKILEFVSCAAMEKRSNIWFCAGNLELFVVCWKGIGDVIML